MNIRKLKKKCIEMKNIIKREGNSMLIYKYTPHNKCHKYDIIKHKELWFANIDSLNDPLDSNLTYRQKYNPDEIKEYWENFIADKPAFKSLDEVLSKWGDNESFTREQTRIFEYIKSKIGVLCMSKTPKNILMWAHYANRHQGIVYGFDADLFGFSKTNNLTDFPYIINYPCDRKYEILSYTKDRQERIEQFKKSLTTKAIDWAYEEEVRFIDLKKSSFARKFNPNCLKSIIFGVKTPNDEIETMIDCCKKNNLNHIEFYKAKFVAGRFELELNKI